MSVVGNRAAWEKVRAWFASSTDGVLIIQGPCGVGKTHNVMQLAEEFDMDVHELHSMERRSSQDFEAAVVESGKSVNKKRRLLFVDDIHLCGEDAIKPLVQRRKEGKPMPRTVITCRDYWDRNIRSLHRIVAPASCITLDGVDPRDMLRAVDRSDKQARAIATEVNGDYRQFLTRLREPASQATDAIHDTRLSSLFDKTAFLMSPCDAVELRTSVYVGEEFMLSKMLFQNYSEVFRKARFEKPLSEYADLFSQADASSRFGRHSDEMATVMSNVFRSEHVEQDDLKFPNSALYSTPIDIRQRFKGIEFEDIHKTSLLDIPNELCPKCHIELQLKKKKRRVDQTGESFF